MSAKTAKKVMNRLVEIQGSNFFEIMVVGMLGQAADLRIVGGSYGVEEVGAVQRWLYEVSGRVKGGLSYSAAMVYNEIDKQVKEG